MVFGGVVDGKRKDRMIRQSGAACGLCTQMAMRAGGNDAAS